MKNFTGLFALLICFANTSIAQMADIPVTPEAGKCYVRCVSPDVYETSEKRVLVKEAHKTFEFIPGQYQTSEDRILVKEATKEFVYIPATYRTVTETITVEEPEVEYNLVPAQFASKTERIEVKPASIRYEYQRANNCANPEGDCMTVCAVEMPAEYRNFVSQVVESPAEYAQTERGGRTITIEKKVIDQPARYEEIDVPAEYTTITKRVMSQAPQVREIEIPAEYAIETIRVLTEKGGLESWEEVECKLTQNNVLPIYYDSGSARLNSSARQVVSSTLLNLLQEKPFIRVEIASHTDARGSSSSNMSLSQKRAESVVNYLVSNGIERSRLVARGYGESFLKNYCDDGVDCPENMHQENRRTEFKVLN